jgi:hypothetical protein
MHPSAYFPQPDVVCLHLCLDFYRSADFEMNFPLDFSRVLNQVKCIEIVEDRARSPQFPFSSNLRIPALRRIRIARKSKTIKASTVACSSHADTICRKTHDLRLNMGNVRSLVALPKDADEKEHYFPTDIANCMGKRHEDKWYSISSSISRSCDYNNFETSQSDGFGTKGLVHYTVHKPCGVV